MLRDGINSWYAAYVRKIWTWHVNIVKCTKCFNTGASLNTEFQGQNRRTAHHHYLLRDFWKSLNTLSKEGGGGGAVPFRIFPRAVFAFLLRLPYGPFTHPLSRYLCIYKKNFQKFLPWKNLGGEGGGVCNNPPPRPEREGVAAKVNQFL